jgi:hypothetical protein
MNNYIYVKKSKFLNDVFKDIKFIEYDEQFYKIEISNLNECFKIIKDLNYYKVEYYL